MLRALIILFIPFLFCACKEYDRIPLNIETSRSSDGSVLIHFKNSSKRDICVDKTSLSVNYLADFPGNRPQKKMILDKIRRDFIDFQYFSERNVEELEVWRESGVTVVYNSDKNIPFQILIQASYCDDVFSGKKEIQTFEYFEIF